MSPVGGPRRLDAAQLWRLPLKRRSILAVLLLAANSRFVSATARRSIVDMAGRVVLLPENVTRIVTVGPVPVLNSFVFAFGKQAALLNGTPLNLRYFHHQELFAPHLDEKPLVQGAGMSLSLEAIIALEPDFVLTMDAATAAALERRSLPVVYLRHCRAPEDIKAWVQLLGEAFGDPQAAAQYVAYFEETIERVERAIAAAPAAPRLRVLSCILRRFVQPSHITDWWIAAAGGRSVTENAHVLVEVPFPLEQMLAWDPEILTVGSRAEVNMAYSDSRFRTLSAVRARRVHSPPAGAMRWSGATVEQPLTVLWAAGVFRPELFDHSRLKCEAEAFYERFFRVRLATEQIDEILAGIPG